MRKYCFSRSECVTSFNTIRSYLILGWFITYIERDHVTLKRQEEAAALDDLEMDEEERNCMLC